MTQTQQVIEAIRNLGGYATFGKLNRAIDFSTWETKTPEASVRRIVQNSHDIFRIKAGLWALKECESEVLKRFSIEQGNEDAEKEFTHSYYQGLAVEIGNLRKLNTFVPSQDKNKYFLDRQLKNIASMQEIYQFAYPEVMKYAKTVDAIWFNERRMPNAFFEIEHSTDIQNSLLKYYELQDYNADFFIVADEYRYSKFSDLISRSMFKPIMNRVKFKSYESLSEIHSKAYIHATVESF